MGVKVYVSDTCSVCNSLKNQLEELSKSGEVEVVSIDTDAGFKEFAEVAMKDADEAGIPTAYEGVEKCQILRGADKMAIKCGDKLIGAKPEEIEQE